jgi:hypothetical protein
MNGVRLRLFLNVFDFVLEDEQVRLTGSGQADERLVIILDHPDNFFPVHQLDPHRRPVLDQLLEVPGLFERVLGRAPTFALLCRTYFS